jgi:hypothetical protein
MNGMNTIFGGLIPQALGNIAIIVAIAAMLILVVS